MTPKHRTSREEKIASVLRMLDSDKPGEVVAAVNALKRLLLALGTDFDGLARGFEKILSSNGGAITQAEMNKAISDAYAATCRTLKNKFHGADDFHSTDGQPSWQSVALFCQRNKHRLRPQTHEFVDNMAARTAWDREPTERMHKYLKRLFYQLGGKIT